MAAAEATPFFFENGFFSSLSFMGRIRRFALGASGAF